MKTRRRTYTAAFPVSVIAARPRVQPVPASATTTRKLRSDTAKERENDESKKKCIRKELWDKDIPTDMLQEILSRLRLKANVRVSLVCKTWLEASVSMRKLQTRRPWLFYPQKESKDDGDYILLDPSKSQTHHLKFPELKNHRFCCSKDGWLLVLTDSPANLIFFLNPFTRERVYLPKVSPTFSGYRLTFSAPPTSTSCFVIFFSYHRTDSVVVIDTWRPGETVWTKHHFVSYYRYGPSTYGCLFLNGLFYCLSSSGRLGVFDLFRATWNMLPVKPCPAYRRQIVLVTLSRQVVMTEHEGDIFVMTTCRKNNYKLMVFKLKLEDYVWEEMKESGLTVFASYFTSFTITDLTAEERNRMYTPHNDDYGRLSGYGKNTQLFLSNRIGWLQPPHDNNFSL